LALAVLVWLRDINETRGIASLIESSLRLTADSDLVILVLSIVPRPRTRVLALSGTVLSVL
jgi:hypothetical protein